MADTNRFDVETWLDALCKLDGVMQAEVCTSEDNELTDYERGYKFSIPYDVVLLEVWGGQLHQITETLSTLALPGMLVKVIHHCVNAVVRGS